MPDQKQNNSSDSCSNEAQAEAQKTSDVKPSNVSPVEVGGRKGPDPVRYGDWEKNGRCIDF